MNEIPILYSFRRCPYAMRARMALAVSGVKYEHREIELKAKPQAMLDASPKGTVPVLVLDNGEGIDESLDIMLWALRRNDPEGWLLFDEALVWIKRADTEFKRDLDRTKYPERFEDGILGARDRAEGFLSELEDVMSKKGVAFICGARRSLADVAIFPFVRQFAAIDPKRIEVLPLPFLRQWLRTMIESDLFQSVMLKHPVWKEEEQNY